MPFGAFVALDGFVRKTEGLIHVSQLADRRVETVEEVLKVRLCLRLCLSLLRACLLSCLLCLHRRDGTIESV
jgi:polyribonucleotide nucleotidyltransferase